MKLLILVSIIASLAIGNSRVYGQEKETTRKEPKVDLKVVYEKTFDEPIVDVMFAEAEVTLQEAKKMGWKEDAFSMEEKAKKRVKVCYPKVIITSRRETIDYPGEPEGEMRAKEIKFYDKNGILLKTVSAGHRLLRSENGRYLVMANLFGDGYDKEGNYIYHPGGSIIYNWNGDEIGKISSGRILQVSDNGYVLGEWVVYDSLGRETGLLKPGISETYMNCELNCSKMSQEGEFIVTVLSMCGTKKALYILWDKAGKILWINEFPFEVSATMPMNHIVIEKFGILGSTIFMIDWDGDMKWQIPLKGWKGNTFSKLSGNRVFVGSSGGYLFCIDYHKGVLLWDYKEDWSFPQGVVKLSELRDKPLHEEMILSSDGQIVVAKARGVKDIVSTIIYFDGATGRILDRIDFFDWVSLAVKDKFLFIMTRNKVTGQLIVGR